MARSQGIGEEGGLFTSTKRISAAHFPSLFVHLKGLKIKKIQGYSTSILRVVSLSTCILCVFVFFVRPFQ